MLGNDLSNENIWLNKRGNTTSNAHLAIKCKNTFNNKPDFQAKNAGLLLTDDKFGVKIKKCLTPTRSKAQTI